MSSWEYVWVQCWDLWVWIWKLNACERRERFTDTERRFSGSNPCKWLVKKKTTSSGFRRLWLRLSAENKPLISSYLYSLWCSEHNKTKVLSQLHSQWFYHFQHCRLLKKLKNLHINRNLCCFIHLQFLFDVQPWKTTISNLSLVFLSVRHQVPTPLRAEVLCLGGTSFTVSCMFQSPTCSFLPDKQGA